MIQKNNNFGYDSLSTLFSALPIHYQQTGAFYQKHKTTDLIFLFLSVTKASLKEIQVLARKLK